MEVIKSFDLYDVVYVKYIQKYWIINKQQDVMEGEASSLPEALALSEALNSSLTKFIFEGDE